MLIQKKTANVVNPEVGGVSGHILIAFFFNLSRYIIVLVEYEICSQAERRRHGVREALSGGCRD